MKHFNTAGPVNPEDHYCIPPLERLPLDEWLQLVQQKKYFVVHAPRQTGKTSALLAFRDYLNSGAAGGEYRCVYVNIEGAQTARDDVAGTVRTLVGGLSSEARESLDDQFLHENRAGILDQHEPHEALREALTQWAQADPRPLALLIDEIDTLVGDSLVSVLRQLRSGYHRRPRSFPQAVVLCGLRDMRDYRMRSPEGKPLITGTSPFNIAAASIRIGDFSKEEVKALLGQHTAETGQEYQPEALDALWHYTQGQPWLVNALASEICKARKGQTGDPVTAIEVRDAKEELVLRRVVHLDYLADKLGEERVRRVIEPILIGAEDHDGSASDLQYVRDLGLIAAKPPESIANPIYMEVIPRELTHVLQSGQVLRDPVDCANPDGSLSMRRLLEGFQAFFRQNSEHWAGRFDYKEAGAQLVLEAYLQGKVNGRGRIEREYALGSRRADLLVQWRQDGKDVPFVVECKMLYDSLEKTMADGLEQTARYMDTAAAAEGHLVIFDNSKDSNWEQKLYHREESHQGKAIEVWGA